MRRSKIILILLIWVGVGLLIEKGEISWQSLLEVMFPSRFAGTSGNMPSTFQGALEVEVGGDEARKLYLNLLALSDKHGLRAGGAISNSGRDWQVQIFCGEYSIGNATTALDGKLVMFQTIPYAFENMKYFESFNVELVQLMQAYGKVRDVENRPPLSSEEMMERGTNIKLITPRCGK